MTGPAALGQARILARLSLVGAVASVVALLFAVHWAGLLIVLSGLAGFAVAAAGTWMILAHRGPNRAAGVLLVVAAPATVFVLYTSHGLWLLALLALALWLAALGCARSALRRARPPSEMRGERQRRPADRPVLIMNPRSGGGKVVRFGLVEKAERLGARVVVLPTDSRSDVAELARQAVADGADLLGVAGGDGTQALVADVASQHDLPFLVISAGTRNHFAMDLGLDRENPARCLDALSDGEEIRVDLGVVSGRPFVNTASFGVYAEIVQNPGYRDDQAGTVLEALPDLLLRGPAKQLDATVDGTPLAPPQALLVSNNPYANSDLLGAGRRLRLDQGVLGVIGVQVVNAARAAELALLGSQARALTHLTAQRVEVTTAAPALPVALDGEALTLPTPVVCTIRPRALRVLVPRHRPGAPKSRPRANWRHIALLALGRSVPLSG